MQVEFFEEASLEVEDHRDWYRKRSEAAEAGFLRDLDHAIEQVVAAPLQWPRFLAGTRRYVFRTYPFSLVYFVEDDHVRVVGSRARQAATGLLAQTPAQVISARHQVRP